MNHTIIDEIKYTQIPISIQYIIISGYDIISWGNYTFVSNLSKLMVIYLYLNSVIE